MIPRLAVLFEYPSLNGGEESLLAVLGRLHGHDFDFTAVGPPHGPLAERLQALGVALHGLELQDGRGRRIPAEQVSERLGTALDQIRPDLVHANSLSMGRLTGRLAPRLRVPVSTHLRDILKLSRQAVTDLNGNCRAIAVSRATAEFHMAQGLDRAGVRVIANGVDTVRFSPRPESGWLRRELGVGPDGLLILVVGQICLRKGQDVTAAAAVELAARGLDLHWIFAGQRHSSKPESVAYEAGIWDTFAAAGLKSRLHRLGYRDDVDGLMNECVMLVHAARQEPFGRVLLEAASSGLPIVATEVGGTAELLQDGVSARLVPPDDAGRLAEAVQELAGDQNLRARLASAARREAVGRFGIDRAASRHAAVWSEMLSSGVSPGF